VFLFPDGFATNLEDVWWRAESNLASLTFLLLSLLGLVFLKTWALAVLTGAMVLEAGVILYCLERGVSPNLFIPREVFIVFTFGLTVPWLASAVLIFPFLGRFYKQLRN
jgi:hypothetical protein